VTWQPEPDQRWPESPAGEDGSGSPDDYASAAARSDSQPSRLSSRRGRHPGRVAVCLALLAAGVAGLAVSAVGIADNLLPRQFTVAQRRQIATWELERRWRALPARAIFPDSVSYTVPRGELYADSNLTLQARLLTISPDTSCAAAVTGTAAQLLSKHGCTAAMRATYVDASGSLVATVAVAVLPSVTAQHVVIAGLPSSASLVRALPVANSPAARFGDPQRQLTRVFGTGPYVILSTAGFADGRRHVRLGADPYLDQEIVSLTAGLASSARQALDKPVPPVVCPGAPGC
jgi:hypothetical protein